MQRYQKCWTMRGMNANLFSGKWTVLNLFSKTGMKVNKVPFHHKFMREFSRHINHPNCAPLSFLAKHLYVSNWLNSEETSRAIFIKYVCRILSQNTPRIKGQISSRNKAAAQLQLRNWCLFVPSDSFPAVPSSKKGLIFQETFVFPTLINDTVFRRFLVPTASNIAAEDGVLQEKKPVPSPNKWCRSHRTRWGLINKEPK